MKNIVLVLAALCGLAACGKEAGEKQAKSAEKENVVNVYSARHYDTDIALYENFKEETGITVNLIEADSEILIDRLVNEGALSPADVFITVDAGRLWRAEEKGLFAPLQSDVIEERVRAHLRHPEGLWFALSKRARVIIYNKNTGAPEGVSDYTSLSNPELNGKVCIRTSSNIYNISLMASLISHYGTESAENWAKGVVNNFARSPQGNDTAQIKAVASGECGIALVNTYYVARLASSDDEADQEIANSIGVIFPGQDSNGTHVNISGAGLTKHAPNKENAVKFLEYLTTDQAQRYLAEANNEYPSVAGVPLAPVVEALGTFREDELNASELGINQAEAVKVYDRAGWQ